MCSKTFLTISQAECLSVYPKVLANAEMKWESGKKLAETGDFGSATSQQIISIEEFIKAIILILDGNGFRFRKMPNAKVFFQDHQIRYFLAYIFIIFDVFKNEMLFFYRN